MQKRIQLRLLGWHTIILWECQLKPTRRDLTLKGLERTLNQIYLTNYSLHKARPYAPVKEGTGTMMTAGGCGNCEQSFLSFPKYVVSSQRISI